MKLLGIAKAAILAAFIAAPASAAVVVPDTGTTDYRFQWDGGLGPIDSIQGGNGAFEWSLTLTTESDVTFSATDNFVVGDEFALVLDGAETPWTSTGLAGDYFTGSYSATLDPGTYVFTLDVTALAPGFTSGGADASFTVTPTVIPLPATMPLLIGALGMAGYVARRKARK